MAETKFGDHKDEGEKRYQHPTQKPIKVIKGCIKHFCCGDEIIFDPFLGSGTTCVAAKMLGFRSIGIEIKTEYCDLSVKRVRRVLSKGKNRSILKGKKMPKLGLFNE
jgi:DNA modification methylase